MKGAAARIGRPRARSRGTLAGALEGPREEARRMDLLQFDRLPRCRCVGRRPPRSPRPIGADDGAVLGPRGRRAGCAGRGARGGRGVRRRAAAPGRQRSSRASTSKQPGDRRPDLDPVGPVVELVVQRVDGFLQLVDRQQLVDFAARRGQQRRVDPSRGSRRGSARGRAPPSRRAASRCAAAGRQAARRQASAGARRRRAAASSWRGARAAAGRARPRSR